MARWVGAGWLTAWLRDERRFWRVSAVLLGSMAVLKGLRWPSAWAATEAQLDYRHGFVKRGLPGTVYAHLHGNHMRPLSAIFFVELAAFFLLLVLLTRRSGLEERFGSMAPAALFASSYVVTFATHLVGYNDIVNAVLAMGLLLVRDVRWRFLAALVVVPVALLVHESFLLCFLPVVLFSFAVETATAATAVRRRMACAAAVVLAALALGINLLIARHAAMSQDQAKRLGQEVAARVDFRVRPDFFDLLSISLKADVLTMRNMIHVSMWRLLLAISVALLLPLLLMLAHLLRRVFRTAAPGARWLKLATLATVAAPLAMHALGWDVVRWNVWCAFLAYLTLLVLTMHLPKGAVPLTTAERNAIILLLAVNMASGHGLFDGAIVGTYPFFPPWLGDWAMWF